MHMYINICLTKKVICGKYHFGEIVEIVSSKLDPQRKEDTDLLGFMLVLSKSTHMKPTCITKPEKKPQTTN